MENLDFEIEEIEKDFNVDIEEGLWTYVNASNGEKYALQKEYKATSINLTENGTYDLKESLDKLELPLEINVNVDPPSGTLEINENGTYDVTKYASAKINIADPTEELEITKNGTYNVLDYASVNVKVDAENTLKKLLDTTKNSQYLFGSYQGTSVDDLIKYDDTENVTNMANMFRSCSQLPTIPLLNTSNVTNMQYMFQGCYNLKEIPQLDTSNVTNMQYMFQQCGGSLTTIPKLDTSKVTNMAYMFQTCNVLTTISQLDMIKCTNAGSMFMYCANLTNITLLNIKANLQIGSGTSYGHLLTLDSLINTIKELINTGSSKKLTIGSANLEKLASTYVKLTGEAEEDESNPKLPFAVCESTDEGAMLINDYVLLKNWQLA